MRNHLLLVDNVPEFAAPIREFLQRNGYKVSYAAGIAQALTIVRQSRVDAAVIDLRLVDDNSDLDFSGLELARLMGRDTPKIVLTAFPSVKTVRAALAPASDGCPLAVAFIAKREPMDLLLRTVRLALTPPNSALLQCFGTPAMEILPERARDLGPEITAKKLEEFIVGQKADSARQVALQTKEAAEYHRMDMWASTAGFLVVILAIILSLMGKTSSGLVTMAGSMVIHLVSALFSKRADKAHQRIEISLRETNELIKLGSLLELSACFESADKRDRNREAIFDVFLDQISRTYKRESKSQKTTA